MRKLKKALRLIGLIVLIFLALSGIAIVPILPKREPMKKETTIELVEEERDEDEGDKN